MMAAATPVSADWVVRNQHDQRACRMGDINVISLPVQSKSIWLPLRAVLQCLTALLHPSPPSDCEFNSPTLALFTSSLFLAAMCAALPAGYITRRFGRKTSMLLGGLW